MATFSRRSPEHRDSKDLPIIESERLMEIPLVSFVLVTYNQQNYVKDALLGALAQTYPKLEIHVSDDCSTDDTYKVIGEVIENYSGPHKVIFSKNPVNLGIAGHINQINRVTSGELIVIAAGDDISMPNRTQKIVDAYLDSGLKIDYFFSSAMEIELNGAEREIVTSPGAINARNRLAAGLSGYPIAVGATQAWSRRLVNMFEPLRSSVWAEDQILGFRGVLLGEVGYINQALVRYRIGSGISTQRVKFSINGFFKNRMKDVWILVQRSDDALYVNQRVLASIIAIKALLLFMAIPISPIFSTARKMRGK